jgi:hypothetical protein
MVEFSVDGQIRTLLALVLAELAAQANGSIERVTLHVLIDNGKVLGVPSSETRAPEANHNFDQSFVRGHG